MAVDTLHVIRDFTRSASRYEEQARIQHTIMTHLAELLSPYLNENAHVLDVGCGTGWLLDYTRSRHWDWKLDGIDVAETMCEKARARGVNAICASAESIPHDDNVYDAIFSSLCVQWLKEPRNFMREAARIVRPGGLIAIATLGPQTLMELRQSFNNAGDDSRVMGFRSEFDWAALAIDEGLKLRHMHSALWKNSYKDMLDLCYSLRAIGAVNKNVDRSRNFTRRGHFKQAEAHYNASYARPSGVHKGESYGGGVWASWQPIMLMFEKPV